ncbi:MAG: sulfatase [Gemmatimonadetes bacterium]|nr:sulfatase [Gemmatimonadota bacterium]
MAPDLRAYARMVGAIGVAWAVLAAVVAPWLIRLGFSERGPRPLNEIFDGRRHRSIEYMLDLWQTLAIGATVVLVLAAIAYRAWLGLPEARRRALLGDSADDPPMGSGSLVLWGAWLGLVGGFVEALARAARHSVATVPAEGFYVEFLWLSPLSGALGLGFVALLVAAICTALGLRPRLHRTTVLLAVPMVYGILQTPGVALHAAAELLLAFGVASMVARACVARAPALLPRLRRSGGAFAAAVLVFLGIGLWTSPGWAERRHLERLVDAPDGLPNLVLIILDTVRSPSLGLHGYDRDTSPTIEALAREGVMFESAISTTPWTLPSHASVFTGEGNAVLGTAVDRPLAESFTTLAEVLRDHGYQTAGFVANPDYTTSASGIDQGFLRYEDREIDLRRLITDSWVTRQILDRLLAFLTTRHRIPLKDAGTVTEEALTWMDSRRPERPFFAFLNLYDAHEPYETPEPWPARFGPEPSTTWETYYYANLHEGERVIDAELGRWVNRYDAGIAFADYQIGRIMDRLASEGIADHTIVIVTSDHGEMWGEHLEVGHGRSLYWPSLHVPLVMRYPGVLPEGVRVETPVSNRHVPRTIGTLTGIAALQAVPGSSLEPLWSGAGLADRVPPPMADIEPFTTGIAPWWAPVNEGPMKTIVMGRLQYILNGDGSEELYDIVADPREERDLAEVDAYEAELERLRATLAARSRPASGAREP